MSSTHPIRVPAQELDQFLAQTQRRLDVLLRVKELRHERQQYLKAVVTIDSQLAELAPALKLALLDIPSAPGAA